MSNINISMGNKSQEECRHESRENSSKDEDAREKKIIERVTVSTL